MPQLNPLDWGPQLIWLVITFGILYLLMKRIALPRIGGVIEARQARISGDLEEAERLHRETQEAIAAYEQALAEAKQKAHAIADQGRAWLKAEMADDRASSSASLAQGRRGREADRQARVSALKDVNVVAADVATDLVKQLIGVAPSSAEAEKAVVAARKE
jgi:F-type H+-transporting ATPase subunit b